MTSIDVSSFVNAAQLHGTNTKLVVADETVASHKANSSIGGKLISWIKLHIGGDNQKADSQNAFRESLKQKFGDKTGELAYSAFAPSDGRAHSLSKIQVLSSFEAAVRETTPKAQDKIEAELTKQFGPQIAEEVISQLESSPLWNRAGAHAETLSSTAKELAADLNTSKIDRINESIAEQLNKLKEPGGLQEAARTAEVAIDWANVSDEDKGKFFTRVEANLVAQSHEDAAQKDNRAYLKDSNVQRAVTNQLLILAQAKTGNPDGELFKRIVSSLDLPSEILTDEFKATTKNTLEHELQQHIGSKGTKTIDADLQPKIQEILLQALTGDFLKPVARNEVKREDIANRIKDINATGNPDTQLFLEKLFAQLAHSQVEVNLRACSDLTEFGSVSEATRKEVLVQIEQFEKAKQSVNDFVNLLKNPELEGIQFASIAKTFTDNAKGTGAEDTGNILNVLLTKVFHDDPEAKDLLLKSVKSGQLLSHASELGNGVELLKQKVNDGLKASGISADNVEAEQNALTAGAHAPLNFLFSSFVYGLDRLAKNEELPVITDRRKKNEAEAKIAPEFDVVLSAFATPEGAVGTASQQVALGLANNIQPQLDEFNITVAF